MKTVSVNAKALHSVLKALNGPQYLIAELQAIRGLQGLTKSDNPIDVLLDDYNDAAQKHIDQKQNEPTREEILARALLELEGACDALAAVRTEEQYLSMVNGGQQDILLALDQARLRARQALAAPETS